MATLAHNIVVIGTSILWGQGLPDDQKIHSLVVQLLHQRGIYADAPINVILLAHSGATLGFRDDDSEDTTQKPRVHGEVPTEYPTMVQQIEEFDSGAVRPEQVDLVLIEGGINDVSLLRLLNPLVSPAHLEQLIEQHCYRHMRMFLERIIARFTQAQIILVGYYQLITEQSATAFLRAFVTAIGAVPGGAVAGAAVDLAGDMFDNRILANCELFWQQSAARFQQAVEEINQVHGQAPRRVVLAVPNIKLENAAFAPDPWLYGIHADLSPQDALAAERAKACQEAGFPRTVAPICDRASAGHPNPKGAKAYAEAIVALLDSRPARSFEYHFESGAAQALGKQGVWFKDAEGRYALFRGVNFATRSKLPPYLPTLPLDVQSPDHAALLRELETRRPELDQLKQLGFNVVRLVVQWKAIEPRPNPSLDTLLPEGEQYLNLVRAVIDALYERGLFVIVDFHQDIVHECYGGDGFPDWALAIDKEHPRPAQPPPSHEWMLRYYDTAWTQLDVLVRHTLRSFWQNALVNNELTPDDLMTNRAHEVRTHLEKTIGATARFLSGCPGVLGYEAFNEPHQAGIDVHEFEEHILPEYYGNVSRELSDDTFLFIEPRVNWTSYSDEHGEFGGLNITDHPVTYLNTSALADRRAVFSFHYYDDRVLAYGMPSRFPPNIPHGADMHHAQDRWPNLFRLMREAAVTRNLIPFLTEFGASQDWPFQTDLRPAIYQHKQVRAYMDLQFKQVEANLLNATYWNYELYNTEDGKDNWNWENFSLLGPNREPRHLDIVARPYPLRSSAKPVFLSFDLETKHAVITLSGTPVDAPTVIYVPVKFHYASGFEVHATSPDLQWDAENQWLYWRPAADQSVHQLIISPIHGFSEAALPDESGDLLIQTVYYWNSIS